MLKMDINLATKRRQKNVIPYIVTIGALFLAVIYTWYNIDLYRLNLAQIARYNQQLVRVEKTTGPKVARMPAITEAGLKILIDEVGYINDVIARETFSLTYSGLLKCWDVRKTSWMFSCLNMEQVWLKRAQPKKVWSPSTFPLNT
jgi:hypothetical protein